MKIKMARMERKTRKLIQVSRVQVSYFRNIKDKT